MVGILVTSGIAADGTTSSTVDPFLHSRPMIIPYKLHIIRKPLNYVAPQANSIEKNVQLCQSKNCRHQEVQQVEAICDRILLETARLRFKRYKPLDII